LSLEGICNTTCPDGEEGEVGVDDACVASSDSGLSDGAIAGISIAVIAVVAFAGVCWFYRKKQDQTQYQAFNTERG